MAAYPSLSIADVSVRAPQGGVRVDQAEDGTVRSRTLFAAVVYDFQVVHQALTSTDRDAVLSHYTANVGATFSFTWPDGSVAHTVVYAAAPRVTWRPGGWDVEVHLIGSVT